MKSGAIAFALSLCAVAGAVHAQSSVSVYGLLDIGFGHYSGAGPNKTTMDSGQSAPSRFGLRGSEDLGGGLSAIFALEAGLAVDTGQGAASGGALAFNRQSLVGLQGGFGRVEMGRVWSIIDDAWSVYRFNNFAAFIFPEFGNFDRTYGNAVKYRTPQLAGLQGGVLYSKDDPAGTSRSGRATELGLAYESGPLAVFAVYNETREAAGPVQGKSKLSSLAARYQVGAVTVRAAYLDSRTADDSGLARASVRLLGADFAVTPLFSVGADLQHRKVKAADKGSLVARVMASYALSKRTSLYANVARLANEDLDTQSFRGSLAPGDGQTGINIGLMHRF